MKRTKRRYVGSQNRLWVSEDELTARRLLDRVRSSQLISTIEGSHGNAMVPDTRPFVLLEDKVAPLAEVAKRAISLARENMPDADRLKRLADDAFIPEDRRTIFAERLEMALQVAWYLGEHGRDRSVHATVERFGRVATLARGWRERSAHWTKGRSVYSTPSQGALVSMTKGFNAC